MDLFWLSNAALAAYSLVLGVLCVYGLHRYFLVLTYYRVRSRPAKPRTSFESLPVVTVQLPMYNESLVAERVIEHACRIDYPRDRLEIQVLDDSTDETTEIARRTADRMRTLGYDVVYLHRDDRNGYKAGALAAGAQVAKGEFIAIFDADFVPPANMLRDTIHYFVDPRVGMVQCRWEHLNRQASVLTRAQAILLDGHFVVEHTARNRSGRYMSFNGTAGIWRKAAIADAGGWQHDTLTEDLDLSYRAQLRGWKFIFLPDVTSPAELPPEMNAFKAQQHRWTKGGAQTCVKLLPQVLARPGDWRIKCEAFFHLTSCGVYILMVLLSVLIGPALIAKLLVAERYTTWQYTADLVLFVVGTGSALSFYVVSQRALRRGWLEILPSLPLLLAIGAGIAFNNAVAAVEGLFCKAGEFVRTPKFGEHAHAGGKWMGRLGGLHFRGAWKAWAELGLALYLTACLGVLLLFDNWVERVSAAIPFLGLFIFGYAYVAIQTLRGRWLASRREATACAPVAPAA
ncbi:MAG: glycosyltransferase family 2 protein [Phycisphaerae bacterium]|jgi:cellulose synthase/poly-beta-1,6-N-acetylglucosamine synthase-like glycosyltransferase|nr:glycosyltransferase [Phycisphaerae bacterium]MCZ2399455.1 glycosyltransferase family 2 protein [Phycisphaerae bacterium]NUQ49194.1 glycosyltransferase [Phycisphaerae bacterium]